MNVNTVPEPGVGLELEPQFRNSTATSVNIKNTPSRRLTGCCKRGPPRGVMLSSRHSDKHLLLLIEDKQKADPSPAPTLEALERSAHARSG